MVVLATIDLQPAKPTSNVDQPQYKSELRCKHRGRLGWRRRAGTVETTVLLRVEQLSQLLRAQRF